MARIYEAFVEGDDQSHFFPNKRQADSFASDPNVVGDWLVCSHDVVDFVQQQYDQLHAARTEILRAAWLLVQHLPMTNGKPDPSRYDTDNKLAHNWVCKNAAEVAETHLMKPVIV